MATDVTWGDFCKAKIKERQRLANQEDRQYTSPSDEEAGQWLREWIRSRPIPPEETATTKRRKPRRPRDPLDYPSPQDDIDAGMDPYHAYWYQ